MKSHANECAFKARNRGAGYTRLAENPQNSTPRIIRPTQVPVFGSRGELVGCSLRITHAPLQLGYRNFEVSARPMDIRGITAPLYIHSLFHGGNKSIWKLHNEFPRLGSIQT